MIELKQIPPSIFTFGFGYNLDTMLLVDIARKGNGSFSFIPDSGFVGTVLVHALASAATTVGQGAVLNLTAQNGAQVRMAFGDSYDHKPEKAASVSVKLDSLYYGQARKVLVAVSMPPDSRIEELGEYLTAQLEYTNVKCETSIVAAKASTAVLGPLVDMDKEAGETLLRQKFVHLLSELIAARSDGASNRKNLPERAQERVQDFLDKNAGQYRGHGILVDTDSQVKLAVLVLHRIPSAPAMHAMTNHFTLTGQACGVADRLLVKMGHELCVFAPYSSQAAALQQLQGQECRRLRRKTVPGRKRSHRRHLQVQKYLLYWYTSTCFTRVHHYKF